MSDALTLREVFDLLCRVGDELASIHGRADNLSPNAALSVGYALGCVMKARSHVARDIDEHRSDT